MRNFKRFLALVMAMLMIVGATVITTGAAEEGDYSDAAQRLAAIYILKGDTNGNLMLDQGVTRWHTALFFVQALTGRTDGAEWNAVKNSDVFTDVPEYGTAIDYAAGIGLIKGRGNGIYGYSDSIIYQDMLVMAIRALGYETKDMQYPYGHILAAEKLGLNENIPSTVLYTQALTRGETAQIIWNMLCTEIAAVDPLTDKILYPGETSISGILGNEEGDTTDKLVRVNMLENAGFSQDVIEGVIVEYKEGKLSTDIDTVTVETEDGEYVLNAAHLGLTAKTRKDTYMNLPVSLYINCTEAEFDKGYDPEDEDCEEKVIFTDLLDFTSVVNLGDEGNIKYTEATASKAGSITLGGARFAEDKYIYDVRMLTEDGWENVDTDYLENFTYTTKDGYTGANSYGEIRYTVIADEEADEETLLMLYMPFAFGRYQTRTLRYQPTAADTSFVTIGTYDADMTITDKGGREGTHFIERMLGEDFVTDGMIVTSDVISASKYDGEASATVTVTGATVKNNEFMFYYYNALDNVLNVAMTCGTTKTGILTSYSTKNETVKIDGTSYDFGFAGAFEDTELPVFNTSHTKTGTVRQNYLQTLLDSLTAGEKNVSYLVAGNNVVYAGGVDNSNDEKQHSFVIMTTDTEIMTELLDITETKYTDALVEGLYTDDNGNVAVAALNISTGKWELAAVKDIEFGAYDKEEDEFADVIDFSEHLENYKIFGESFTKFDEFEEAAEMLTSNGIFMVRANKSKVYTVAPIYDPCIEFGTTTAGIIFSDAAAKTNLVKAVKDEDVDPARLTISAKTVTVVINNLGEVGVRTGIQKNVHSVEEAGRFYSATGNLIVLAVDSNFDVKEWESRDANDEDETYYIALKGAEASYERLEDETYDVTVSGLFNLRTFKTVSGIKVNVEDLAEAAWVNTIAPGMVLHMDANGDIEEYTDDAAEALLLATDMREDDDEDFTAIDMADVAFIDEYSIVIDELDLDGVRAVNSISIEMATLDLTALDFESDYDLDTLALDVEYDEEIAAEYNGVGSVRKNADGDKVFSYSLEGLGEVTTIAEPDTGILDQYIIDMIGKTILVAATEEDYLDNAGELGVELIAAAQFDEDTGDVVIYLIKSVVDADTYVGGRS